MHSELFTLMINKYQVDVNLALMKTLRMCKHVSNTTAAG